MDLNFWKDKYRVARNEYADQLSRLLIYDGYASGQRGVFTKGKRGKKDSLLVRNLVHELVEAQVDSSIPAPKVSALWEADIPIAQKCEHKLRNENDRMHMTAENDVAERFTYEYGGCVYHVEWDNSLKTHNTVGEVVVSVLHPKQLIPQPGVYDVQRMDYLFLELPQTKEQLEALYGIPLEGEAEERPEARVPLHDKQHEELVTQIVCYYKNDDGSVGRLSWVNDILLEDLPHYHVRRIKTCTNCGAPYVGKACDCGSSSGKWQELTEEKLSFDVVVGENVIPQGTILPFYQPSLFPVVVRKNISKFGSLLGISDVDVILDQQESLKKLESNILEKLIKGGSFITLPKGLNIKLDGETLNVVELADAAQKSMIDVYNVQPDISADLAFAREIMEEAKGLLGVTDAFLGRKDNTATSGKAKELSVQQSAGRLESKRIMKAAAYAEIYELVIKYLVAFSDEPRPIVHKDMDGKDAYSVFSRYDFLELDDAGNWYYNIDFLFSTDASSDFANNRASMWEETRLNFSQGAFGDPANPETQVLFWQFMEEQHYPNAGRMKDVLEERLGKQAELAALQEQNANLQNALEARDGQLMAAEEINASEQAKKAEQADALLAEIASLQATEPMQQPEQTEPVT